MNAPADHLANTASPAVPAAPTLALDTWVAGPAIFFMFILVAWTLLQHAASFGHISWHAATIACLWAGLPIVLVAAWLARRLATLYAGLLRESPPPAGLTRLGPVLTLIVLLALLWLTPSYSVRFALTLAGGVLLWWMTRERRDLSREPAAAPATPAAPPSPALWACLALLAVFAAGITLACHRSDLDDSSFLQIASQTTGHPDLAPLTFDASLGVIREPFRFAPYRVATYETLAGFLSEYTPFSLLTVYYLLLPALTAFLSIGVAYLLARWFLPPAPAVVAAALLLLILLAWGDTSIAFGNRVYIRLFQGKGLLIALTTPMTILAGLALLRRPSLSTWLFLAAAQLAAIGVSSSGLVCAFVTTGLLAAVALQSNLRPLALRWFLLGTTLIYPGLLGLWIRRHAGAGPPLNEIGTYLPINASFGLPLREALALAGLVLGIAALGPHKRRRDYALLTGAMLLLAFNPWLAEFVTRHSARNMNWRLAWAAPLPLFLAIAWTAALVPAVPTRLRRLQTAAPGALLALLSVALFLGAAGWTLAKSNNAHLHWPQPKLPPEYAVSLQIAADLNADPPPGPVLAADTIAAWLPLVAPRVELIMAGHTYPIMLQTILPPSDFTRRMQLFQAVNGRPFAPETLRGLLRNYHVAAIVVPAASDADRALAAALASRPDIALASAHTVAGYRIIRLAYPAQTLRGPLQTNNVGNSSVGAPPCRPSAEALPAPGRRGILTSTERFPGGAHGCLPCHPRRFRPPDSPGASRPRADPRRSRPSHRHQQALPVEHRDRPRAGHPWPRQAGPPRSRPCPAPGQPPARADWLRTPASIRALLEAHPALPRRPDGTIDLDTLLANAPRAAKADPTPPPGQRPVSNGRADAPAPSCPSSSCR